MIIGSEVKELRGRGVKDWPPRVAAAARRCDSALLPGPSETGILRVSGFRCVGASGRFQTENMT